jgi:phosphohistidine phosphatase
MKLYIIRHAEAVPLDVGGVTRDEDRYLTPAGHASCAPLAAALRRVGVRLDRVYTSPLVRARQTAAGMLSSWGDTAPALEETVLLAPGAKKRALLDLLNGSGHETLAIVGHNPDLSELVGWLIGDKGIGLDMDKGGVALIEFDGQISKAAGTLVWLVTPAWC